MPNITPEDEAAFRQFQVDAATEIATRIRDHVRVPTAVSEALEPLKNRVSRALESLRTLHRHAQHDWRHDAMTLLRAMYDAHLQALYIAKHRASAEERASLFLDYFWVEQHDAVRLLDKNPTRIARKVMRGARRAKHESTLEEKYRSVRGRYLERKGNKTRRHWYPGNLSDLAKDVGLDSEYEILQNQLSGAVHVGPLTALSEPVWSNTEHVVLTGWTIHFRVLNAIATHHGVPVPDHLTQLLEESMANIFDWPGDDSSD